MLSIHDPLRVVHLTIKALQYLLYSVVRIYKYIFLLQVKMYAYDLPFIK